MNEEEKLKARIAELESNEHLERITFVWRHKVQVLSVIIADAIPFLKGRLVESDNNYRNADLICNLLDRIEALNLPELQRAK